MIPTEGLNYSLNASFKGAAQTTTWYIGLLADYVPLATDTNATIAAHELTAYTVAGQAVTRGVWPSGTVAAGALSSATPVTITFTAPTTVFGAFLSSTATKGAGTAGVLASVDRFAASRTFLAGESLDMTSAISSTGV